MLLYFVVAGEYAWNDVLCVASLVMFTLVAVYQCLL
jgi:hypothetical protein